MKKRKHAHRRPKKSSVIFYRFIGIVTLSVIFILIKSGTVPLADGSVLGLRFLAQETPPPDSYLQQPPPQTEAPNMQPGDQSAPPPNPAYLQPQQGQQPPQYQNMTPEQQRQYGTQQMTPEQREQNMRYQQMTPEQQQEYNKQINEQIKQKYGNQGQTQTTTQQNTQGQTNPQTTTQMTPEQARQEYLKYQQATPEQQREMRKQYEKQAEQKREEWRQEASKYGFQISAPTESFSQTFDPANQASSFSSYPTIRGQFLVGSAGGSNINLNNERTNVVLGNGAVKARSADGTEVAISQEELEKITSAIKLVTGSEISQSGDVYLMKRGQVEAETHFPISFNVATKTFSVETPDGIKEVVVLPDEAVEKAIESGVIAVTSSSKVQLTNYNDLPVYQVEGNIPQKMFGFVPISIGKTTYISAENGNVVNTNQNYLSIFLDTISF